MRAASLSFGRASLALVAMCAACVALAAPPAGYDTLRIVGPEPEETVHDNSGNVTVSVALSPALRSGDRIVILLDGQAAASGSEADLELSGIERGEHTLQAQVIAADGSLLVASEPVTFYLWRASRLFPGR